MPIGADFLQLDPALAPGRGLTTWLTDAIRTAVTDGRLPAGSALPASRVLAEELTISRGVVVEAYQRLKDEGVIAGRAGAGTVVAPLPPRTAGPGISGEAGRERLPRAWRDGVDIDLSPGVPDLGAFPRAAWLRAERAVLSEASSADLGYGDPRGSLRLRRELAGSLARSRGLRAGPDEIIIVAGVAQSLALLAHCLHARGHATIAVEDPGSRGSQDELAFWGLKPVPVSVDQHGLVVSELRDTSARAVAVTPAHQFPAGVVLAPPRRRELLDWAAQVDGLVIEDDYDAEFRYDRAPVPAVQASAPHHVAYAGSVSKTLVPGMRLGWLIPPPALYQDLVTIKHATDLGCPALAQLVLARLIATGELDRHIRLVRKRYRQRRDAILAAIAEFLPTARVSGVAAGLHLLITFPGITLPATDTEIVARAREAGVLVHPLTLHRMRDGEHGFVMSYASNSPDKLHDGVRRLAEVIS
jgi:GntR family transcriptional regulator / MocR family aminotransferase